MIFFFQMFQIYSCWVTALREASQTQENILSLWRDPWRCPAPGTFSPSTESRTQWHRAAQQAWLLHLTTDLAENGG